MLELIRAGLRRGSLDFRLLVPTATMAEHIRNQLAREGFALRPGLITTLWKFTTRWVQEYPEVPAAAVDLIVDRVLGTKPPEAFAAVAGLPGFRTVLARLIDEFSSAGYDPRQVARALDSAGCQTAATEAFCSVYRQVEREFRRRGWISRPARLKAAADEIRSRGLGSIGHVYLDGFFTLSGPELEFIDAIRKHVPLTVTLPLWEGSEEARTALLRQRFAETRLNGPSYRQPKVTLFTARTIDQEAEEIARRILEQVAAGRQFREIGIVLRSRTPYVPLLQAVFQRFGIPARFYFAESLESHAIVRYLTGAVEAMLGGWEHEAVVELLKMTASGFGTTPACDRLEFAAISALPGKGLDPLRELCDDPRLHALLDRLATLAPWAGLRQTPAEWAAAAKTLRSLVRTPAITDGVSHEAAALWRSQAAALAAFDSAMDEAAAALPEGVLLPFLEFWRAAQLVLSESRLRVPDGRRNVVHVMDVYEARQWELPVVFVCGLLEKQFPMYHSGDPVFPEDTRVAMNRAGLNVATAAGRRREEEFLFEIAVSRAASELVLSYPETNAKGDPNVPSFFLDKPALDAVKARSVRPAGVPRNAVAAPGAPYLRDAELLDFVRVQHRTLRPTAIETFLACPFHFFLAHTLGLEEPPARPADRLGPALQGLIVHETLAELQNTGDSLDAVFERVFNEVTASERVPAGCRAEMARIAMLRDLRQYLNEALRLVGWAIYTEQSIRFPIEEDIEISGRIDCYAVSPDKRAVVIDFKYSGPQGIANRIRGYEEGAHVQGALYLLGLHRVHGYTPAGWFYCGLRGEVKVDGWHIGIPGFEQIGTSCTPQVLWEKLEAVRAATARATAEIRQGRVAPGGRNTGGCDFCSFADVCRMTETEALLVGTAAESL
ncbi:MAG: PD-(D/E)XK nuclease family protein [Rhodospirillales bacterium]